MYIQCIFPTHSVPEIFLSGLNILPLLLPYPREERGQGERTGREGRGEGEREGREGRGGRKVKGEGGNKTKVSKTKTNTHLECFS